jgi:hypothetical protein
MTDREINRNPFSQASTPGEHLVQFRFDGEGDGGVGEIAKRFGATFFWASGRDVDMGREGPGHDDIYSVPLANVLAFVYACARAGVGVRQIEPIMGPYDFDPENPFDPNYQPREDEDRWYATHRFRGFDTLSLRYLAAHQSLAAFESCFAALMKHRAGEEIDENDPDIVMYRIRKAELLADIARIEAMAHDHWLFVKPAGYEDDYCKDTQMLKIRAVA